MSFAGQTPGDTGSGPQLPFEKGHSIRDKKKTRINKTASQYQGKFYLYKKKMHVKKETFLQKKSFS